MTQQLVFDLGHRPALAREDFLVTPSNEVAVAWIDRWPDWPQPVFTVYGASGSGKSHLAEVWRHATGARRLTARDLRDRSLAAVVGSREAFLFDGSEQALADDPALEEFLFHLYNRLRAAGGFLLLTGEHPPAQWTLRLADLRSRLAAAPAVELGPPDDLLIEAVLFKLFSDRQLKVTREVLAFAVKRMERSFAAARRLVEAADRAALAARRDITVPLMRDILAGQETIDLQPETRKSDN